eukprot:9121-Chlamydomonas_euryale.AAC.5
MTDDGCSRSVLLGFVSTTLRLPVARLEQVRSLAGAEATARPCRYAWVGLRSLLAGIFANATNSVPCAWLPEQKTIECPCEGELEFGATVQPVVVSVDGLGDSSEHERPNVPVACCC